MTRYFKNKKADFYYKISPLKEGEENSLSFKEDDIEYKTEHIITTKGHESYGRTCVDNAVSIFTKKINKKEWDKALEILKEFINQLK